MIKLRIGKRAVNFLIVFLLVGGSLVALGANTPIVDSIPVPFKKPQLDITYSMNTEFDSLSKIYGHNKIIPKRLEKQIIFALSYFPELVDSKIEFRIVKSNNGIISTRPEFSGVLKSHSNRKYIVFINDTSADRKIPSFINGPVNGQVGILCHELCHVVYYSHRSGIGLVGLAAAYMNSHFVDRFENKTDSMDIERGLGYQLIYWVNYLHKSFEEMRGKNEPLPFKEKPDRERYMSVASINRVMSKSKVYGN